MSSKNTLGQKAQKTLKKLQSLSEGQKLFIAIIATVALAALILVGVNFIDNIILKK